MFHDFPVTLVLRELQRDNLLPAILFRTSRKQCDDDVERLHTIDQAHLDRVVQDSLRKDVKYIVSKYGLDAAVIYDHQHFETLIRTGVGAHHAGQLLVWRLLLEELMSRGVLRLLIATGTVAAGVDFPARTVVITAHSKRGTEGFNVLTASEFQQMSGRAGRRGKDSVGICLIAPGMYCDARVIHQVSKTPPEPLRSAYYAAPSTVLNLLKYRSADELRYIVSKSLGGFLDRKSAKGLRDQAQHVEEEANSEDSEVRSKSKLKKSRRLVREAEILETRQLDLLDKSLRGLERLGYVADGSLTEKGSWAAELCTSIVLELADAIDAYIFSEVPLEELVGLVASIAGDSYRNYFNLRQNPIDNSKYQALEKVVERVAQTYLGSPFASEVKVQKDAAVTVLTWMEADDWNEYSALLRLGGLAEGDAARLISQTADHLHQLSRLAETHPDLARLASQGRALLLRPPVTDTYQVVTV